MNKGNKLVLFLLISLFVINFLISDNILNNFNDNKTTAVFAQETSAGQFSTYTNEKYNITMQYPSDWTKTEVEGKVESDGVIEIITFSKDFDTKGDISFGNETLVFSPGVSLVINPNQSISLDEYLRGIIDNYEEGSDLSSSTCSPSSYIFCPLDFKIVSSSANTDKTLAGHPAYVLDYIQKLTNKVDDIIIRNMEIGAKIDNDYYFVTYYAEEGDEYDKSLPLAQKMIDSIKIGNDAVASPLSPKPQSLPQQQQPQQQNINNLDQQQQLVDLIATTISNANNIDKNQVIQALNDMIETTKAKGGNVIEFLKKIADVISKEPSGNTAIKIINAANKK